MAKPKTIAQYITAAAPEARPKLREILELLRKAAPGAKEALKWGAPSFSYDRILFSVSAFKKNLGFMPTPAIIAAFKDELGEYAVTPAVIHFEYGKPLPKRLITKIAKARVADYRENDSRWM